MFMLKVMFRMLGWPNEAIPKNALQSNEKTIVTSKIKV